MNQNELEAILALIHQLERRVKALMVEDPEAARVFDPDLHEPPMGKPNNNRTREDSDWVCIVMWSKLFAINVRKTRGAYKTEVSRICKAAGYHDGRGLSNWTGYEKRKDGYWVTAQGVRHLYHYLTVADRVLPADLEEAAQKLLADDSHAA